MRKVLILLNFIFFTIILLYSINQKEELITNGEKLILRLAPVDPRSLMQGDYMRLDFNIAREIAKCRSKDTYQFSTHQAIIKLDERGVATFVSLYTRELQEDEKILSFKATRRNITIVTDAWFFQEGEAQRFQKARYGEFRILADGKALLVGMLDEELLAIK